MIEADEYRFSKRKTLAVCIDPRGKVIVRAPKGYPKGRIAAFLAEKEGWIERHRQARIQKASALPSQIDGYELSFLGEPLRLQVYDGKRRVKIGDTLYLPATNPEKSLLSWLKKEALGFFKERTDYWQTVMGVRATSVKISGAKKKWGSCSADNELRFTYRLAYAPTEMIDYVVVHELSHIRYKNHSAGFWQEVKKYLPDYACRRAWLKSNPQLLEIF